METDISDNVFLKDKVMFYQNVGYLDSDELQKASTHYRLYLKKHAFVNIYVSNKQNNFKLVENQQYKFELNSAKQRIVIRMEKVDTPCIIL
jgi:hypothetical protein